MKNLKIYLSILFISLLTSSIFIACSSDDTQALQTTSTTKKTESKTTTNKAVQTICDITGSTVVSSGSAVVYAGSTVSYSYTNNTGTASNIVWAAQNANPPGSITLSGSGATINATFASNFLSGSISADGSDGTALTCNTLLNVTKAQPTCCVPTMHLSFVCRGSSPSGNLGGFLTLIPPTNCPIDWQNNVSKIDFRLEGGPSFSGDDALNGKKVGTLYPPFTNVLNDSKIIEEFYYVGCLSRVTAKVTIYFKNGCPPVSLNAEALKQ